MVRRIVCDNKVDWAYKSNGNPVTYQEDGIKYVFFGADPYKQSGVYGDRDIGDLKSINNLEITRKGKVVLKPATENVKADRERRVKISFNANVTDSEKIVEWKTLEQFSTENY